MNPNEKALKAQKAVDCIEPVPQTLANSAGFLLGRAAQIIREQNETALAPMKITPRELGMLRVLESEGAMTQQQIGRRHNVDRTTVVQIIDALEARDLVTRVSNESDRRSNLIYITPRGKKTMSQGLRIVEKQQESFLRAIEPAEWDTLKGILTKLINLHLSQSP